MRRALLAFLILLGTASASLASAPLEIVVFLSAQKLAVLEGGQTTYEFDISSGKLGHWTPPGVYQPQFLSKHHRSSKYHNAPMPNSVFFYGDYAIHGTEEEDKIGLPASMGCVRLTKEDSAIVYGLVVEYGFRNTQIRVVG